MRAIKIHGTKKKIQKLVQLSKQALRDGAYRVANRLHAVALNMEGKSAPDISNILKVHRSKISIWLHNWQEEGMNGLLEGYRTGRPHELSETQLHELSDILDSGPVAYGFNSGVWTCPMVARIIEAEFSVSYHSAHVSRLLHQLGFSVQRPKRALAKADKTLQSKWVRYDYPNIKKNPKTRKRSSSLRTKPASDRTLPSIKHGRG